MRFHSEMLPTEHVPDKDTSQLLSLNGKEMTTELKGNIDCSLKTYSKQSNTISPTKWPFPIYEGYEG